MPPYETKCLERIFNTTGVSDTKLVNMIKAWLSDAIAVTHFNDYDYTIIVGEELLDHGISQIFDDPTSRLFHILDSSRIKMWCYVDPRMYYSIKIEWRAPVYREDMGIDKKKLLWVSYLEMQNRAHIPQIKKVIYNYPATIIFWADDTKTVVQCQYEDVYDPEKGLAMAIAKKALGNTSRKLNDVLHKWENNVRECKNCNRSFFDKKCKQCLHDPSHPDWEPKGKKEEEPSIPHSCSNCKYNGQKISEEPCKSCDSSFWSNWKPKGKKEEK